MPRRLRPTAEIHPDAILVGDPGRAMALAQVLIEKPQMANHARGLWGYSGTTAAGRGLTVQSTGMGGPSAALVLADLVELGVQRAVRVGTCAAIDPAFEPGDLVWVRAARPWSADHPGAGSAVRPDEALAEQLRLELGEEAKAGRVASVDFLHPSPDPANAIPDGDVADMQTALLLTVGGQMGIALAAVLVVTAADGSEPLADEVLLSRSETAAQAGLNALL
jgi:uridine phosphorylase